MAAPKGYDSREELPRLRGVRYENYGEYYIPGEATLRKQFGDEYFETNPYYTQAGSNKAIRVNGEVQRTTQSVYRPYRGDAAVYNPDERGLFMDEEQIAELNLSPAQLTQVPTSSSNASRPRTVAAGWHMEVGAHSRPDKERKGRLTVMFRDGTLYNYYDVSYDEWIKFKGSLSKGPMLNRANKNQSADGELLRHPHGPADISDVPEQMQSVYWRVSREAQLRYKTTNRARAGYKGADKRLKRAPKELSEAQRKRVRPRAQEYVPLAASKKSGLNPNRNRGKAPSFKASRPK